MKEEKDNNIFSEEELPNIQALVTLLRQIRARLLREGVDLDMWREKLGINKKPTRPKKAK
jgi:hypothetical protein